MAFDKIGIELKCSKCGETLNSYCPDLAKKSRVQFAVEVIPCKKCTKIYENFKTALKDLAI